MSFPRYPKYKDSGVEWLGEVPEHWITQKFRHLFRESPEKIDREVVGPMLSVSGYRGIEVKDYDDENRRRSDDELIGYRIVRAGQLVVNTMWLNYAGLGVSEHEGHVSPAYRAYSIDSRLNRRFVHNLMRSGLYVQGYTRLLTGIRPNSLQMSRDDLMEFPVLVPSPLEQSVIAAFLDRETAKIDALVEEQRRLMELLKEKRQAVISHAVTKGLNPHVPMKASGIEWLGDVPEHWEIQQLKNIAARLQGRLIVQPQLYFAEEGVPIVFGYNIKDGVIDEGGLSRIDYETDRKHAHAKARAGDLFTVRLGDPGKTVVVPKSLDGCHFASIMWIHQDERFHSAWLSHCMNSAVVQRQIEAVNYGAAQTQFNIRDAVDFRLPVPPLEEQREIVAAVDQQLAEIDALTSEAQRAIDLLQERRTALISAAVTGQIDVRGLAETAAA